MTKVLINHKVNDYTAWKNSFDHFADFRRSSGEKSFRIMHPVNDPNNLTLIFDWDTQERAETFLESNELKTAMKEAGVAEKPKIQFLDEIATGSF